jgi:protein-L-isoaspartate(D-aspartate) O-methyltransferase
LQDPDEMREVMVRKLREGGAIRSEEVASAFRAVPRHRFAPGEPPASVYSVGTALVTKRNAAGMAVSSVSAASIQAAMLEQARIAPGMRVLEIGSGGYNAALIRELVGDGGQVTTVDIDEDIVVRARELLAAAGYDRVNVVLADAEDGVPEFAPYDRVIVTAGAWDIPPAWLDQLTGDGRIVVPFRLRGLTRSVVFERDGSRLVSRDHCLCGFMPMRGAGEHAEDLLVLDGDGVLLRINEDHALDAEVLGEALRGPRLERWSGVVFDQADQLDLWLGTAISELGALQATKEAIDAGLVGQSAVLPVPTAVREGSFAYRVKRPIGGMDEFETGVYAHGPDAGALADEYVELIRTWDDRHRHGPGALIEVFPAGTSDAELPPGRVVEKDHTRVVISWP